MAESELIELKDDHWLFKQKIAGRCVSAVLKECAKAIESKQPNLSLKDLENIARLIIKSFDCTPTFENYKGFPSAICTSVNNQLVHGIVTDYVLQDGDVVSVDLGATYDGAIADAAYTTIYGQPKSLEIVRLLKTCQGALQTAIKAIKAGNRVGTIGYAINNYVKSSGFGLITKYGGHGLSWNVPHAPPFIANKAQPTEGVRIQPGLTIAIEPLLVIGSDINTKVLNDNWTVITENISAHYEHTVYIESSDVIHIITNHDMEV